MRLIILVFFTLFAVSTTINCANSSRIALSGEQDKKIVSQLTEYEVFAQKYEATFGEKPSDEVWDLGKKTCGGYGGCGGGQGCGGGI